MKTLKPFTVVVLAFSMLASAHAALADTSCPTPNQIVVLGPGSGFINQWISLTGSGFGQGLGGSSVGSYTGSIDLGAGMQVCFYGSSAHASPAELAKNINQVPEKSRQYLKYLQGTTNGFIMLNSFAVNK